MQLFFILLACKKLADASPFLSGENARNLFDTKIGEKFLCELQFLPDNWYPFVQLSASINVNFWKFKPCEVTFSEFALSYFLEMNSLSLFFGT